MMKGVKISVPLLNESTYKVDEEHTYHKKRDYQMKEKEERNWQIYKFGLRKEVEKISLGTLLEILFDRKLMTTRIKSIILYLKRAREGQLDDALVQNEEEF